MRLFYFYHHFGGVAEVLHQPPRPRRLASSAGVGLSLLGRRVYAGLIVVLVSAMCHGLLERGSRSLHAAALPADPAFVALLPGMKWFLGVYTSRYNRRHKL